ncbi:MAG: hypothetical protein JNL50_07300 [Phycisphaerae bacterium]|nr:hypothetical protein [Phycisphaerae bacterium]
MTGSERTTIRAGVPRLTALAFVLISPALGVSGRPAIVFGAEPPLEPVEQGGQDANPLAAPARMQPLDLRLPLGFDRVYRVVEPGRSPLNQRYARSSGALTAVFPRSQYTPTRDGVVPEIPAGTVFYIGDLPEDVFSSPPPGVRRGPTYLDLSARAAPPAGEASTDAGRAARDGALGRSADRVVRRDPIERPSPESIMTDDGFRVARVCELIDRAASASAR